MNHMTLNDRGQTDYAGDYNTLCECCESARGERREYFDKWLCDKCNQELVDNLDEYDYDTYKTQNDEIH